MNRFAKQPWCWAIIAAFLLAAPGASAAKKEKAAKKEVEETQAAEAKKASEPEERSFRAKLLEKTYLSLFASWGFSKPTVNDYTSLHLSSTPTLMQWGIGVAAAYRIGAFDFEGVSLEPLAGLTADYRFIGQYSDLDPSVGNSRGTRLNPLAPWIGIVLEHKITVQASLQFLGSYHLSKKTDPENADMSYSGVLGTRIVALYQVGSFFGKDRIHAGLQYEYLRFSTRDISGVASQTIDPSLALWQAGVMVAYVF